MAKESNLCSRLIGNGVKLLVPPPSTDGILSALDSVEDLLSSLGVGQDPSPVIRDALLPAIKGLNSDKLFKHLNLDVRVSVLGCIHELIRVLSPEPPYKNDFLKEIFQQTVEDVFGKLSSLSGRSYVMALKILRNVAKCKSGMILLELGCNALIRRMFHIFLETIQQNFPDIVFTNMEEIMTCVIREADELSLDLLKPLLHMANKENQVISPLSWRLAVKVLKNCSEKLDPYLKELSKQLRKEAEACTYVNSSILPDMPELDNVINPEIEKNGSSKSSNGPEQIESLQNVDEETFQMDAVGSQEGLATNECELVDLERNSNTSISSAVEKNVELNEIGDDEPIQPGRSHSEGQMGDEQIAVAKEPVWLDVTSKKRKYILSDYGMIKGKGTNSESNDEILPKGFKNPRPDKEYREELIGARVLVWRLNDRRFYEGVVENYDPVKKEHKVAYLDADVQKLRLEEHRWLVHERYEISSRQCCKRPRRRKEYREEIVGSRVMVWWPQDLKSYEAVVLAYDPVQEQHKVVYFDGDEEYVKLVGQNCIFLGDKHTQEVQEAEIPNS